MKKVIFLIFTILLISALITVGMSEPQWKVIAKLEKKIAKKPDVKTLKELIKILEQNGFYYEAMEHINSLSKLEPDKKSEYQIKIRTIKFKILKNELSSYKKIRETELEQVRSKIEERQSEIEQFKIRMDKLEEKVAKVKDPKIVRDLKFQIRTSEDSIRRIKRDIEKNKAKEKELIELLTFIDNILESL